MSGGAIFVGTVGVLCVALGVYSLVQDRRRPATEPNDRQMQRIAIVGMFATGLMSITFAIISEALK